MEQHSNHLLRSDATHSASMARERHRAGGSTPQISIFPECCTPCRWSHDRKWQVWLSLDSSAADKVPGVRAVFFHPREYRRIFRSTPASGLRSRLPGASAPIRR